VSIDGLCSALGTVTNIDFVATTGNWVRTIANMRSGRYWASVMTRMIGSMPGSISTDA
jgi:hypothetical protein